MVQQLAPAVDPWLAQFPASTQEVPILYVSCDGTGTPMRREELEGRRGKQTDGSSKTREVKLGAVFTHLGVDEDAHPLRDHESTSYVASYAPSQEFSLLLRAEARRRGIGKAQQVVFLSDGAVWAEDLARGCFHGCVSILDFYRACERINVLARALNEAKAKPRADQRKEWVWEDGVDRVIAQARNLQGQDPADPDRLEEQLGFLERHRGRMLYGTYRRNGWFIGSGVIEAGCRTVVGKRLKQSGMLWSIEGATCVLNLRTLLLSQRLDSFWKDRIASKSASNDSLSLVA